MAAKKRMGKRIPPTHAVFGSRLTPPSSGLLLGFGPIKGTDTARQSTMSTTPEPIIIYTHVLVVGRAVGSSRERSRG